MVQIYSMHLTIKIINATMRYNTADKLYTPVKCCNLPRHRGWLQQCLGIIATYTVTKKACNIFVIATKTYNIPGFTSSSAHYA